MERNNELPIHVLAVDDDEQMLTVMADALGDDGVEIHRAQTAEEALSLFEKYRPQIVLADLMLPAMGGMEMLDRVLQIDPSIDFVLVTGHYTTESAVLAIQKGAADYLTKPLSIDTLRLKIRRFIEHRKKRRWAHALDQELLTTYQFEGMIGRSPYMLDVFDKIQRVAPHYKTVLVEGATGTGKELVAKALHALSPVASDPFVVCNCAAVVETLFESELFGYVKGAFTGATQDKVGLFEYANGGTVFLDEIGEMPIAAQAKLLRVLQNQEVQRVGSPLVRKVDVRVIAATNRDLARQVIDKQFREDLFYRLSMIEIKLPRLADRRDDLPLLQRHFVAQFSKQYAKAVQGISRRAQTLLAEYWWPGNVRELENVIGNACMMTQEEWIDISDLPERLVTRGPADNFGEDLVTFEELQRRYAHKVLAKVGGNKLRTAEILGVSRTTLYKLLGSDPEADLASRQA